MDWALPMLTAMDDLSRLLLRSSSNAALPALSWQHLNAPRSYVATSDRCQT